MTKEPRVRLPIRHEVIEFDVATAVLDSPAILPLAPDSTI
jgi:hypothetical protein